jgi:hypothetical protein
MWSEAGNPLLDCEIIPLDAVRTGPAFGPPWSSCTMGP